MSMWRKSRKLEHLAQKIILVRNEVSHVDSNDVLFLLDEESSPKSGAGVVLARTYKFAHHPIQFFTEKRFCVVFYEMNCQHLTQRQRALLMLHELMHIPATGSTLTPHDIEDFSTLLHLAGINWSGEGAAVPDILEVPGE